MRRARKHLTFENVLVTVVAFVVLAGGSAIAAQQLGKNSVGKRQLKANAVTTAKIKKNAVTAAKIKAGAVDGAKVKDGSLILADLYQASLPFGRVVHEARSTGSTTTGPPPSINLATLDKPTYTQEVGRDDSIVGAADVSFPAVCEPPRVAIAYVLLDQAGPVELFDQESVAAAGVYQDPLGTGPANVRLNIGTYGPAGPLSPPAAVNHTLSVLMFAGCKEGTQAGTVSNLALEVIGVK